MTAKELILFHADTYTTWNVYPNFNFEVLVYMLVRIVMIYIVASYPAFPTPRFLSIAV